MTKRYDKLFSAIDIITLIYSGWITLYLALGFGRAENAGANLAAHLSIFTAVVFLAWWHKSLDESKFPRLYKVLGFVRSLYPVALFGYFFTSGYSYNRIIFRDWLDPFFMNIDQRLFGYLPSMEWGKRFAGFWTSELFHFAYFCYYPMIAGLPLYLYFKKPKAFGELIFILSFVFYMCYFIYSIVPVIGGRYIAEAMELTRQYRAGIFTHIMVFIYRTSNHLGGAFPSSHIAVTLVLTISALQNVRKMGYVFLVIAFFLTIATVYCHYHWFIDAVFGVFAGVGGYFLAKYVYRKLQGAR
ncbi:MAG TPA: hypothetical protein GXX77_00585 [Candidatus Cloacimonetes bacterium]|nr:hypothetical protein [Candidatus Cloacimonadota bacterium]